MEYEDLASVLPKPTLQWDNNDVVTFLQAMSLDAVIPKFKILNIDGKQLSKLNRDFISNQLKVTSLAYMKKLVGWFEFGREQYDEFLKTYVPEEKEVEKQKQFQEHFYDDVKFIQSNLIMMTKLEDKKQLNKNKLLLTVDSKQYIVVQNCKLGRQPNNNIILTHDSVSRFHAQIVKQNGQFLLKDYSKFGTFIKISSQQQLYQKLTILLGATQIQITKIRINKNNTFDITFLLPDKQITQSFSNKSILMIGKKSKQFHINDETLCNQHAKIYILEDKIYIESIEGVCYRKIFSGEKMVIENGDIYRIGTHIIACKFQQEQETSKKIYEGKNQIVIQQL